MSIMLLVPWTGCRTQVLAKRHVCWLSGVNGVVGAQAGGPGTFQRMCSIVVERLRFISKALGSERPALLFVMW